MRLANNILVIVSATAGGFILCMLIQSLLTLHITDNDIVDLIKYCNYELNQSTIHNPISDILNNCAPNSHNS